MTTHNTSTTSAERERRLALYAICFGFFLVLLDTTALNVATTSMEREFGGAISGLQWVVNSYSIVFASLLLTAGAVGDRYGAKRLYQAGLALFTAMSLCCAAAPGVGVLIGLRMLQGLGAAMMLPASLALLSHAFPNAADRARAVAFWAAIVSLGFAAGPALGGVLISCFGWRSIFLLNVPVGLAALVMIRRFVSEAKMANPRHIDWPGQAAASLALFSLSFALIEAGRVGWLAPRILGAFAASIVLVAVFAYRERTSASPVLPPSLFSKPAFSVSVAAGVVLNFGAYGTLFVESIYLQGVRHLSALATGLVMVPLTIMPAIITRLIDRYHAQMQFKHRLVIGQLVGIAGAATLACAVGSTGYWATLTGLGLIGAGIGLVVPAMTMGVLSSSPAETSGLASGILNAGRQVGGALGVALMGTLVQTHQNHGLLASFAIVIVLSTFTTGAAIYSIPAPALQVTGERLAPRPGRDVHAQAMSSAAVAVSRRSK